MLWNNEAKSTANVIPACLCVSNQTIPTIDNVPAKKLITSSDRTNIKSLDKKTVNESADIRNREKQKFLVSKNLVSQKLDKENTNHKSETHKKYYQQRKHKNQNIETDTSVKANCNSIRTKQYDNKSSLLSSFHTKLSKSCKENSHGYIVPAKLNNETTKVQDPLSDTKSTERNIIMKKSKKIPVLVLSDTRENIETIYTDDENDKVDEYRIQGNQTFDSRHKCHVIESRCCGIDGYTDSRTTDPRYKELWRARYRCPAESQTDTQQPFYCGYDSQQPEKISFTLKPGRSKRRKIKITDSAEYFDSLSQTDTNNPDGYKDDRRRDGYTNDNERDRYIVDGKGGDIAGDKKRSGNSDDTERDRYTVDGKAGDTAEDRKRSSNNKRGDNYIRDGNYIRDVDELGRCSCRERDRAKNSDSVTNARKGWFWGGKKNKETNGTKNTKYSKSGFDKKGFLSFLNCGPFSNFCICCFACLSSIPVIVLLYMFCTYWFVA